MGRTAAITTTHSGTYFIRVRDRGLNYSLSNFVADAFDRLDGGFVAGNNKDGVGGEDDPDNGVVDEKSSEGTVAKEGATPAPIDGMDVAGKIED